MEISQREEGFLDLVVGSMFSGKTEHLINIYNKFKDQKNIFVINHNFDNRYSTNDIVSHNGNKIKINMKVNNLSEISLNSINNFQMFIINEGQFFPDLIEFVKNLLSKKKHIYVSGFDGDFKQEKFGQILDLIPICDNITKLKSICNICHQKKGIFSKRIVQLQQKILVGSEETYIPICRFCFDNENKLENSLKKPRFENINL